MNSKEETPTEIEVKFILSRPVFERVVNRHRPAKKEIEQVYLSPELALFFADKLGYRDHEAYNEWRIRRKGDKYFFTAKGPALAHGTQRREFETAIDESLFSKIKEQTLGDGKPKQVDKTRFSFELDIENEAVEVSIDDYRAVAGTPIKLDFVTCEVEVKNQRFADEMVAGRTLVPELAFLSQGIHVTGIKSFSNRQLAENGFSHTSLAAVASSLARKAP